MQCTICTSIFSFLDVSAFFKNEELAFLSCGQHCCIKCLRSSKACPFCGQTKAGHMLTGNARTAIKMFELEQQRECEDCLLTMSMAEFLKHICDEQLLVCACLTQIKRWQLVQHQLSECVNFSRLCKICNTFHATIDLCPAEIQMCYHCNESFTRQTLEEHMASHLACCNVDCDAVSFGFSQYMEHRAICEFRNVECKLCSKEVPLAHVSTHLKTMCCKRIVTCEQCDEKVSYQQYISEHEFPSYCLWCLERKIFVCQFEKHKLNCRRRPTGCGTCSKMFPYCVLNEHICPKAIIKCDLCLIDVMRYDIKAHVKRDCINYVRQCLKSPLCTFQYTNAQKDTHDCPQLEGPLILKPGALVDYCNVYNNVWEVCQIKRITSTHFLLSSNWFSTPCKPYYKFQLDEILTFVHNYKQVTKYGCFVGRSIFQKIEGIWQKCKVLSRKHGNFCQPLAIDDENKGYCRTTSFSKPLKVMGYFTLEDFKIGDMFLYGDEKQLVSIVQIDKNSILFCYAEMKNRRFSLNFVSCTKKGILSIVGSAHGAK